MAAKSTILLSKSALDDFFASNIKKVFSQKDFFALIEEKRYPWNLPATVAPAKIASKWVDHQFLNTYLFQLSDGNEETFYLYGAPSIFEIAVSLRNRSYISHYPAVQLNNLTSQIPKTIYTTLELSPKLYKPISISQASIDKAFAQSQRRSQLQTIYEDYSILLLQGKNSARSGVLLSAYYDNAFSFTGLERTLIDITVRPNYAGGAFAVLDAYRRAVESNALSIKKLLAILTKMDFIYPYHQAIGFYLERAEYSSKFLDEIRMIPRVYQFYLDYGMMEKKYDENWKIWFPKGI